MCCLADGASSLSALVDNNRPSSDRLNGGVMMKARKLVGRLAVAVVLVGMMVLLTAAPAFPAQPEAGTISTGSGVQVWNGHSCPADVPVNIVGLSAGLGGYEAKVGWDPARFSSVDADIAISLTPYLTNGGTRQQTGDSSTPALKAVSSGAVKYGAYSWGTGNPPGNMADGQLSTVSIKPTLSLIHISEPTRPY